MPIFFIILVISYLLGNLYIFVRGLQAIATFPAPAKVVLCAAFWLGALLMFATLPLRDANVPEAAGRALFRIGAGWLVFTLYMAFFLACFDAARLFNSSFQYGFAVSFAVTAILLAAGYVRYQHPSKRAIDIHIDKGADDGCKSVKIVAISDLHLGLGTGKKQLQKYVEMINGENPDLILISGDLIDNSVAPVRAQRMEEEIAALKAPMGIYMVPGNHEYISGIDECAAFISRTQIKLLRDSAVALPCGIQIVGRDDRSNRKRRPLSDLITLASPSKPIILLDHQPYDLQEAEKAGVDLQFSGHTHNGQIFPLNLLAERLFDIGYGYEKRGGTNFYVSSGLSLWGPPFRIGTRSEMVVFNCSFGQRQKNNSYLCELNR